MHSFIPSTRFFPYLTWTEIQAMPDRSNVVIIQPIGAIEQHGPHLPLAVDAAISLAVLGKPWKNYLQAFLPMLYRRFITVNRMSIGIFPERLH